MCAICGWPLMKASVLLLLELELVMLNIRVFIHHVNDQRKKIWLRKSWLDSSYLSIISKSYYKSNALCINLHFMLKIFCFVCNIYRTEIGCTSCNEEIIFLRNIIIKVAVTFYSTIMDNVEHLSMCHYRFITKLARFSVFI